MCPRGHRRVPSESRAAERATAPVRRSALATPWTVQNRASTAVERKYKTILIRVIVQPHRERIGEASGAESLAGAAAGSGGAAATGAVRSLLTGCRARLRARGSSPRGGALATSA